MLCAVATVITLLAGASVPAAAAPDGITARFAAASDGTPWPIDHAAWTQLLATHVVPQPDGSTRVAYDQFSAADREALAAYLSGLARINVARFTREEQVAYWINLYNALTVQSILGDLARGAGPQLAAAAPDTPPVQAGSITVEGTRLSLRAIADSILVPLWHDPRIRYALANGTAGGPDLQPAAFEGANLDKQLDAAALHFIAGSHAARFVGSKLEVSQLYAWYRDEFGGSDNSIIRHLMAYADPDTAMRLQFYRKISGTFFDWRLNAVTD